MPKIRSCVSDIVRCSTLKELRRLGSRRSRWRARITFLEVVWRLPRCCTSHCHVFCALGELAMWAGPLKCCYSQNAGLNTGPCAPGTANTMRSNTPSNGAPRARSRPAYTRATAAGSFPAAPAPNAGRTSVRAPSRANAASTRKSRAAVVQLIAWLGSSSTGPLERHEHAPRRKR